MQVNSESLDWLLVTFNEVIVSCYVKRAFIRIKIIVTVNFVNAYSEVFSHQIQEYPRKSLKVGFVSVKMTIIIDKTWANGNRVQTTLSMFGPYSNPITAHVTEIMNNESASEISPQKLFQSSTITICKTVILVQLSNPQRFTIVKAKEEHKYRPLKKPS
jgi:uncharacterized protein YwgA